ncbi:MAG: hypothetical protein JWM80_3264 [Cyanobacteria bacterium RYN_339]|nr:hypothetical protein [Cyanobacteria bacterium RYN_339]
MTITNVQPFQTRLPAATRPAVKPTQAARAAVARDRYVPSKAVCAPAQAVAAPAVQVTADAGAAIDAALKGEPIKLAVGDTEPRGLAIRELIPRGELRAFEIGMAGQRFEVVIPANTDAQAMLVRVVPMVGKLPAAVQQTIRRVTIQDPTAERIAYATELAGPNNSLLTTTVRRTPEAEGKAKFVISDRAGSFELMMPAGERETWAVAQAFQLRTEIPAAMRGALKQVKIEPGANPMDAQWAETYHTPGFKSAATGGNGQTTFWSGTENLQEEYFLHEFGHVLGQTYSTKNTMVPDGWEDAIAADPTTVTDYAKSSPAEDFAESFWVYLKLLNGQVPRYMPMGPHTVAEFAERFPKRAAVLESIFKGELKPH